MSKQTRVCKPLYGLLPADVEGIDTLAELALDRHNYYLTCKAWAKNLEASREKIVSRWGEMLYRRFRLYLWGSAHAFLSHGMDAYRVVLQQPAGAGSEERTVIGGRKCRRVPDEKTIPATTLFLDNGRVLLTNG